MLVLLMLTAWPSAPGVGARGQDVRLGEQFDLNVDHTATITSERLEVGFADVVSDSRCPRGVQCIWQGVATIRLSVERPPDARTTLTLRAPSASATGTYGKYSVSIVDVKPYPEANRRHRREEYVVTLIVARAE
jgi:hypothetical protein